MRQEDADIGSGNRDKRDGSSGFNALKELILAVAIVFGWASDAWAASPATLTTLRQITSLSNAQAAKGLPVAFEATVTYKAGYTLFVQDEGSGIYVFPKTNPMLVPGDRILILGKTLDSFRPTVVGENISVLHHGDVPKPVPATYDQLIRIQRDCLFVTIHGVVRTADKSDPTDGSHFAILQVLTDGGYVIVVIQGDFTAERLQELLDAEVEINGVAGGQFDGKMQILGAQLNVSSPADIRVIRRGASPWSLPTTSMDLVMVNYRISGTQRVRVHGTITYYQPRSSVVLQDGAKSLWISTATQDLLQVGDVVDATGFPEAHNGFLALARGEILDSSVHAPIAPLAMTRKELAQSHHIIDLVTVEGKVVSAARGATQDEYHMTSDGQLFTAIYRHPYSKSRVLPPMKKIPIGAIVHVTGICITEDSNPFAGEVPFDILMRSPDDIEVVVRPSLINTRNLLLALGALLIVVFIVIARGWALERRMRRQTAMMSARAEVEADLERQRSRILEYINGSRPLAEILVQIAAMVSSTLEGAPCWCELADGEEFGDCRREQDSMRIVRASIDARVGPALGTLIAGLDPNKPPIDREAVVLHNGARLATLAIETRQLYSDLRRRSEYDQLTDIPNRFAIEKFIEVQIEEARQSSRILGLIYIDLDKFKPINDTFGHRVGDIYLQEVARRMSRQLLGSDMLARLGGDEFAALVSLKQGLTDLDRIVARLAGCFDEPFLIEGHFIQGSASTGVAICPKDGATKDALLNAADAAMYRVKNSKRHAEDSLTQSLQSESPVQMPLLAK
jgi:diguanylate cyclase (GGDEF)-like protein